MGSLVQQGPQMGQDLATIESKITPGSIIVAQAWGTAATGGVAYDVFDGSQGVYVAPLAGAAALTAAPATPTGIEGHRVSLGVAAAVAVAGAAVGFVASRLMKKGR
jgi:hypothetical protein